MSVPFQLITNGEDLRRATDELFNKQAIGLDTETTELDPYLGRLRLVGEGNGGDGRGGDLPSPKLAEAPRAVKLLCAWQELCSLATWRLATLCRSFASAR